MAQAGCAAGGAQPCDRQAVARADRRGVPHGGRRNAAPDHPVHQHAPVPHRCGAVVQHRLDRRFELSRFAEILRRGGELDGVRVLQPETLRAATRQCPPTAPGSRDGADAAALGHRIHARVEPVRAVRAQCTGGVRPHRVGRHRGVGRPVARSCGRGGQQRQAGQESRGESATPRCWTASPQRSPAPAERHASMRTRNIDGQFLPVSRNSWPSMCAMPASTWPLRPGVLAALTPQPGAVDHRGHRTGPGVDPDDGVGRPDVGPHLPVHTFEFVEPHQRLTVAGDVDGAGLGQGRRVEEPKPVRAFAADQPVAVVAKAPALAGERHLPQRCEGPLVPLDADAVPIRQLPDAVADDGDSLAEVPVGDRDRAPHRAGDGVEFAQLRFACQPGALVQRRPVEFEALGVGGGVVREHGEHHGGDHGDWLGLAVGAALTDAAASEDRSHDSYPHTCVLPHTGVSPSFRGNKVA